MHPAWVAVAVANVWAQPGTATIPSDPNAFAGLSYAQRIALVGHMPTQALYGERVLVLKRQGSWVKVAIPDQPSPLDRRGYPGWLLSSQLRATSPESSVVTAAATRVADRGRPGQRPRANADSATRSALVARSGLPPLNAATRWIFHSGCDLRISANAGTWEVSVPIMPARSTRVAHVGSAVNGF